MTQQQGEYQNPQFPLQQLQPDTMPVQMQPCSQVQVEEKKWYHKTEFADKLRDTDSFHIQADEYFSTTKYSVKDSSFDSIFTANQNTGSYTRKCWGTNRSFVVVLRDSSNRDVLLFERATDCSCCCGYMCSNKLKVTTQTGDLLGTVEQSSEFTIKNEFGRPVYTVKKPRNSIFSCSPDKRKPFELYDSFDGSYVGTLAMNSALWDKSLKPFDEGDYFSVSFPATLDPSLKIVCLGALFLKYFNYYNYRIGCCDALSCCCKFCSIGLLLGILVCH